MSKEELKDKTDVTQLKGDANELAKAAKALYEDKELFEKKEIKTKDKDGKESTVVDYDKDAIYKKVEKFVEEHYWMKRCHLLLLNHFL